MSRSLRAAVLARTTRWTGRAVGAVVVYHRLGRSGRAAALLGSEVPPDVFQQQLRYLVRTYRVVPLAELVAAAAGRHRGEAFPVALTFDDDLESHVAVALPALRAARVPATFFLTGATLAGPMPFWWDDLAGVIDRGSTVRGLSASLQAAAHAGSGAAVKELARTIEELPSTERAAVADELRHAAGSPADRGLGAEDVAALAGEGFEIGFHTLRHDPLVPLADAALAAALHAGRAELEAVAGPLRRLAYPHGRADARVAAAARAARFVEGYTGAAQPVGPGADPLLLPRYQAPTTVAGLAWRLGRLPL